MAEEYFYGVTLSEPGASVTWDGRMAEDTLDEFPGNIKLVIKQILLGHEAKENEFNVIEADTLSIRDPVKIPIAVLKVGEARTSRPDIEFSDSPVTFTLTHGSGPVHIHGQQLVGRIGEYEDMEEMHEEISDEDEPDDEDEEEGVMRKKPKLSNNAKGKPPVVVNKNNKPNNKK